MIQINLFPYASRNAIGNVVRIDNQVVAEYNDGGKLISPTNFFPDEFLAQIPIISWGSRKEDNAKMMKFYFSDQKLEDICRRNF